MKGIRNSLPGETKYANLHRTDRISGYWFVALCFIVASTSLFCFAGSSAAGIRCPADCTVKTNAMSGDALLFTVKTPEKVSMKISISPNMDETTGVFTSLAPSKISSGPTNNWMVEFDNLPPDTLYY